MKTKFLKAMIVDQDVTQGRAMALLIKDLFTKIHFEQYAAEIIKECEQQKPRIIFFNLNVAQRTTNFEILEKLPLDGDKQTIIFGYTDSPEPELIAHAIEEGFNDIFVKPFDADIIATKINKYFKFEKTQGRDLSYTTLRPPLHGMLNIPLKLMSVDENGFEFKCEHYISKGGSFKLTNPIVHDIFEEDSIDLMISRTWTGDNYNDFFFYAEPMLSSEKTSAALRRFILRKI